MKLENSIFQQHQQLDFRSHHQQNHSRRSSDTSSLGGTKYHRAAVDGYIDMLCDASKRDSNTPNEGDGLTPTLLAAQSGHLDALRILVGRGGDPEKTASDGSSALHLAAARGHLNCVSFLVNFGVNMWSLDNDLHTAKDAAAIEQRKEVLDFLDQMMAKQSALNTKNVQKLKEKAKLAAEKRLKQLRKAQLKAIKQVEKDERYLVKLSHNRRLLKAAHSISDIKLVGRQTQQPQQSESSIIGLSANNLINHKLQLDLLGRKNQQLLVSGVGGNIHKRSVASSTTGGESSASYSTSSISSYLSSSAGSSSPKRPARPKYSDLVAVNGAEMASTWQSKVNTKPEQQSLKSSSTVSTIGTRLWGIGGVSRKVQLRRLLKAGAAQSSSDLTTSGSSSSNSPLKEISNKETGNLNSSNGGESSPSKTIMNKLCNVQPAIKLKLNAKEMPRLTPNKMARAISEPDFGAALRDCDFSASEDEHEEEKEEEEEGDAEYGKLSPKSSDNNCSMETKCQNINSSSKIETSGLQRTQQLPSIQQQQQQQQQVIRDDCQSQLLNQCLSQLKMRHEALSSIRNDDELCADELNKSEQLLRPSKLIGCNKIKRSQNFGRNSDELIQHQLNAGEFPLRPSLIKQKQQQLQTTNISSAESRQKQQQLKSTTISVDSIGSAGSFVKRNSCSSSSAKSSDLSSPTSYSSSSCSSSSDINIPTTPSTGNNNNKSTFCHEQSPDQPDQSKMVNESKPPLPPPLPPKTPAMNNFCSLANQIQLRKQANNIKHQVVCEGGDDEPTIGMFLESNGLGDLSQVFAREKIDLEALVLLTEEDLKSLEILLGPRRKLLKAIDQEKRRLERKAIATTTIIDKPMYVMVDTQL